MFPASEQSTEATVKAASDHSHSRPAPILRPAQPHTGSPTTSASRYALTIHCEVCSGACRSPEMVAMPMLTRAPSSWAMNAPTITTAVTRHTWRGTPGGGLGAGPAEAGMVWGVGAPEVVVIRSP
jgi:hypothetical protein